MIKNTYYVSTSKLSSRKGLFMQLSIKFVNSFDIVNIFKAIAACLPRSLISTKINRADSDNTAFIIHSTRVFFVLHTPYRDKTSQKDLSVDPLRIA